MVDKKKELKCEICGMKRKMSWRGFFSHVKRLHGLDNFRYVKEYIEKDFEYEKCGWCDNDAVPFIIYDEENNANLKYNRIFLCNDEKCKNNRKKHNPRSYYHTMKTRKISKKEAIDLVKLKSPFHLEYFNNDKQKYKEFQNNTSLKAFIKRYGENEGIEKYKKYIEKSKKVKTKEFYIEKLGYENGIKKWKEICKSRSITKEKFIKKYGKKEGEEKYEKFLNSTIGISISKTSINWLTFISVFLGLNIQHGKNNVEKSFSFKERNILVDGFCEELNVIFEFYGDKWHCNPKFYKEDDLNIRRKKAKNIWKYDKKRLDLLASRVNKIIVCWEDDWNKDKKDVLIKTFNLIFSNKKGIFFI